VGGGPVQIQNKDKKQGQNIPHLSKNPSIPGDIEGYMAHPRGARSVGESPTAGRDRTVERVLERRGKPFFFDFWQGQKAQNPGPSDIEIHAGPLAPLLRNGTFFDEVA
jgi:hypothetical protein